MPATTKQTVRHRVIRALKTHKQLTTVEVTALVYPDDPPNAVRRTQVVLYKMLRRGEVTQRLEKVRTDYTVKMPTQQKARIMSVWTLKL